MLLLFLPPPTSGRRSQFDVVSACPVRIRSRKWGRTMILGHEISEFNGLGFTQCQMDATAGRDGLMGIL